MEKGIFIAESMASTGLVSLLRNATQETVIENGSIVKLGDLVTGESDLHKAVAVTAATDTIYLVDGVELEADQQQTRGLDDFENPADKPFRVRKPMSGDRFSISASMVNPAASKGNLVEAKAGNKLAKVATATAGATVFEVKEEWVFGTKAIKMLRLEVK